MSGDPSLEHGPAGRRARAPASVAGARAVRDVVCAVALIVAAATASIAAVDATVPGRRHLMVVLFCVVPGAASWSRAVVGDAVLWLVVVVASSLGLSTAFAVGLVWAGWWHPRAAVVVLGAVAIPPLVLALVRPPGGS